VIPSQQWSVNWLYGGLFVIGALFLIVSILFWTILGLIIYNLLQSKKKPIVIGDLSHIELDSENTEYYSNLRDE
jgi:hypothetical protein